MEDTTTSPVNPDRAPESHNNDAPDVCANAWEWQLFDRLGITLISDDEFSRLLEEQDARSTS